MTVPVYVPTGRTDGDEGFAVKVRFAAEVELALPLVGDTESQGALLGSETVKPTDEPVLVSVIC